MARPTPKDVDYPPTLAFAYDGSADVDLTAQFPDQAPFAACEALVTNIDGSTTPSVEALVVRLQGAPTTDVTMPVGTGACFTLRGAFTAIRAATTANVRVTFFWQGGPS